jgi:hypothetical protein
MILCLTFLYLLHLFKDSCPTLTELRENVYKKSNKAAAGINGLSYVPYKKCRSIMFFVLKIVEKIWESQIVPSDWAQAFIILRPNLTF